MNVFPIQIFIHFKLYSLSKFKQKRQNLNNLITEILSKQLRTALLTATYILLQRSELISKLLLTVTAHPVLLCPPSSINVKNVPRRVSMIKYEIARPTQEGLSLRPQSTVVTCFQFDL